MVNRIVASRKPPFNPVPALIDNVRQRLRERRGHYPALMRTIKQSNPHTKVTYRWLQSFSDRQDGEPAFSKVWEVARILGIVIW